MTTPGLANVHPADEDDKAVCDDLRDVDGGQYVWDALHHLADEWVKQDRHEEAALLLGLLARAAEAEARVQAAASDNYATGRHNGYTLGYEAGRREVSGSPSPSRP